ncbi:MAG: hypothetical protein RR252_08650 [Longicatena sp.]
MKKYDFKKHLGSVHITPKVKKYALVMCIGVFLNEFLSTIIVPLDLPLWLDMSGTALVAIVLEPAAGIIVAFIDNFYLSVFRFDASSVIYLALGASMAVITGIRLRNKKQFTFKNIFITWALVIIVTSLLSGIITLWRTGGISDLDWERHFYYVARDAGASNWLACFFGAFAVKVPDISVSGLCVALSYILLPKKLKEKEEDETSLKP